MNRATSASVAVLVCATLGVVAPASAHAGAEPDKMGNVQRAMEALAKTEGVVGAIGQAYVNGRLAGQGTAGSRLLNGKGGKIPAGSRYRIGSQTKGMTATVVLQLVKEKKLGLEDKLADLLPEVAEQDLVELADRITVRQLLRHNSGIPEWYGRDLIDLFDTRTHYKATDLLKVSRGQARQSAPGAAYAYSSTNYTLLGMIIEKVTGRSLPVEFHRRIFGPLGMRHTYLPTRPPQGINGPHGHGYAPDAEGRLRDLHRFNASYGGAAGGVVSTARDMSTYWRAYVQGRLLPASLRKVLDPPQGGSGPTGPQVCGGAVQPSSGGSPGFIAVTYTSLDGRRQFAVSTTLKVAQSVDLINSVNKAAEAVLCPGR